MSTELPVSEAAPWHRITKVTDPKKGTESPTLDGYLICAYGKARPLVLCPCLQGAGDESKEIPEDLQLA